jgi:hypothetical protein
LTRFDSGLSQAAAILSMKLVSLKVQVRQVLAMLQVPLRVSPFRTPGLGRASKEWQDRDAGTRFLPWPPTPHQLQRRFRWSVESGSALASFHQHSSILDSHLMEPSLLPREVMVTATVMDSETETVKGREIRLAAVEERRGQ